MNRIFLNQRKPGSELLKPVKNIINYFNNREAARKLEQLIEKERPDLAHMHLIWGQIRFHFACLEAA